MDWIQGIQNAIRYIENNILEELDYDEIATQAYVTSFYFQRAFSVLCGFTLGEYIRNRRLTLAGVELSSGTDKIIDVALRYRYDSPDSFTKAFTRFHGIPPSSAKKEGATLKFIAPLKIKFKLEGGNVMDYRLETKEAFNVIGVERGFNSDTAYADITKFWYEHFENGNGKYICGMFGISYGYNSNTHMFNYMIADSIQDKGSLPDGFITKEIPAKTWAVFPVKGAIPSALQEVNSKIWSEWLPNCHEYELDGNINIEMYSEGDINSTDYYSEIWIPVKKK
ncbi:AraC family transcriptional regulator [Desulfovibrio litoralis]|uniref:Transcriptional regulator, AraC family n=1 Tax=Desulfovibrio litoralis DSM 11393 TaxID=1121455 RepID=A0A1M7TFX0_9BACT|nr:AraC family transcriptional regulator [Desulfovibrio litoralis]SHN69561.1 transcriptional regulator, AraC family [Desulfovibrio litoralis DSM 11393]